MSKTIFPIPLVISLLSFLLAYPSTGHALPREHDVELEVSGGYFRAIGSGNGNFNLDLGLGYYTPAPAVEVGIRQGFLYTQIDGQSDPWVATTAPFVDVHAYDLFGEGTAPFIGGFVGAVWNDDDITGTVGPSTGVKLFFNDQTYFVTRYRYEWFFDELKQVNEVQDANHVVTVGIGYLWR